MMFSKRREASEGLVEQSARSIVGVVLVLVICCLSIGAQDVSVEKVEGGKITEGLQLILCAETTQLKVGKPSMVRVGIRNCTPKAVDLSYTGPMTTYFFDVRRDDGAEVPLSKEGTGLEEMRRNGSDFGLIVEPGETFWAEVDLARWFDLGATGTYSVVASRSVQLVSGAAKAFVRSNTLSISIRQ